MGGAIRGGPSGEGPAAPAQDRQKAVRRRYVIERNEYLEGVKTFFVLPDPAVIPEDFLRHFFLRGFETYVVNEDQYLSLRARLDAIIALFPEVIFFFNLDHKAEEGPWPEFIARLQAERGDRARIGVLYRKRSDEGLLRKLEKLFLFDIGITCGCIPLEYQKNLNIRLLTGVLTANQANGRRKHLRTICEESCRLNFEVEGRRWVGTIQDISVSHFSCTLEPADAGLKPLELVKRIQLNLGGTICLIDAVMVTKRVLNGYLVHVFVFRNSRGQDGLDAEMLQKVNNFIFSRYQDRIGKMVRFSFDAARLAGGKRKASSQRE